MFLPFALPGPFQGWRKALFYNRVAWNYRIELASGAFGGNKLEYKVLRVIGVALVVKLIEKGARAEKEGYLADYNARKANIEAAEKAMWDEELAAHAVDTAVAEAAVLRQRTLDWKNRQDFQAHSDAMERMHFPFNAKMA